MDACFLQSQKLLLFFKRRSTFSDTGTYRHLIDTSLLGSLSNDDSDGYKNECFPLIKDKVSSRDPLYMSSMVKHLYNIRNRNTKKYGEVNADLQARVNELISNNQVQAVRNENRKHGTGTKGLVEYCKQNHWQRFYGVKHQLCYQPCGHKPVLSKNQY